jgi:3-oxoadipate enol-lactonase
LFYETAGDGDPIVLIHDGILQRETWNQQFVAHRMIRYDRRGYGRSTSPHEPYSLTDDLQAVFSALKVDRATLVGCSAGGSLAIDFAIAHPREVRSLVLVGAVIRGLPFSDHYRSRGGRWSPATQSGGIDELIDYWTIKDPYYTSADSPALRARVKALLTANPQDLHDDRFAQRPEWTALSHLAEIRVPTLIVIGEHDIPDVHAHAGAIQGIATSKPIVVLPAGHLAHMEQTERFNALVREFLKTVP